MWNVHRKNAKRTAMPICMSWAIYCYISKGMVLNSHEDSDDEEFKKVDLISNTKNKIHCRKFLEGKGCRKIYFLQSSLS